MYNARAEALFSLVKPIVLCRLSCRCRRWRGCLKLHILLSFSGSGGSLAVQLSLNLLATVSLYFRQIFRQLFCVCKLAFDVYKHKFANFLKFAITLPCEDWRRLNYPCKAQRIYVGIKKKKHQSRARDHARRLFNNAKLIT